jgi:peptidoglycan/LPS O-acetylase OafA/YrhL
MPRPAFVSDQHVRELDGLRGIAVLMVLVWHFVGTMVSPKAGWWADLLHQFTIFGRTGVDLFFVLSGFLIIGILHDQRNAPNLLSTFYTRRFFRIYPPYFVLVGIYWLCFIFIGPSQSFNTDPNLAVHLLAQFTFNFNALMAYYDGAVSRVFGITWSVAVEEWFYLLFPLVIMAVSPKRLSLALCALAIFSVLARATFHLLYPDNSQAPYVLLPFRLDGLCIGGLLALIYRNEPVITKIRRERYALAAITALFVLPIPFVIGMIRYDLWRNMFLWGHLYLSLSYGLLILFVLVLAGHQKLQLLRSRFLCAAGLVSYSLYLFHPMFLNLVFELAGRQPRYNEWLDVGLAALALIMTVAFCFALQRWVEGPLRQTGRRFKFASAYATGTLANAAARS